MRAATRPHPTDTTRDGAASANLLRLLAVVAGTLSLLALWHPTIVRAQAAAGASAVPAPAPRGATQPTSTTHVVRAGESLWSIAQRYYGTGAAWTQLAERNKIALTSARPLTVGMRLVVPRAGTAAAAAGDAPRTPPSDTPRVALIEAAPSRVSAGATPSLAAQTAGKGDAPVPTPRSASRAASAGGSAGSKTASPAAAPARAGAAAAATKAGGTSGTPGIAVATGTPPDSSPTALSASTRIALGTTPKTETPIDRGEIRIGITDGASVRAARAADAPTIFLREVPTADEARAVVQAMPREATAPRRGEFEAAPFTLTAEALRRGGRIVRRVGAAAVGSIEGAQRVLIADDVEITPPAGTTLSAGDRLLAARDFGALPSGARVVIPGGVLQVSSAEPGKPVVARVRSQSGLIEQGNVVLPLAGQPAAASAAAPTGDALRASVVWVDGQSLLPTLQSYVLLDAGTSKGVRAGDEFALVRARGSANTGIEERIAVVRVVRSDAGASTAIVVKQDKGEIQQGLAARLVARVP